MSLAARAHSTRARVVSSVHAFMKSAPILSETDCCGKDIPSGVSALVAQRSARQRARGGAGGHHLPRRRIVIALLALTQGAGASSSIDEGANEANIPMPVDAISCCLYR
jgi:hypothetical protein